jgi:hypothetical protein
MSKMTDTDFLQAAIDQILEDDTFKDMLELVGAEITQQAALISLMQANLDKALEAYPTFKKDMQVAYDKRKPKVIAPKKPGLII